MKYRLFGVGVAVLVVAVMLLSVRAWLNEESLPQVLSIAAMTAVPTAWYCLWAYKRAEACPRRLDAPHHECRPALHFEGAGLHWVCPECGRRWHVRDRWRLLNGVCAVAAAIGLRLTMISVYSDALYFRENEAVAVATATGLFIVGFCAATFLINGAIWLLLRGRDPEKQLGWPCE